MQKHITVVGALHIGYAASLVLGALILFMTMIGAGVVSQDETALVILTGIGCLAPGFLIMLAVPGIVGGVGVIMLKPWARYMALVLAVLDLFSIPIGTAVGVYTIWVLMQDETEQLFASGSSQ